MTTGIEVRTAAMGEDVVFLVTGGTAHIGATATARVQDDGSVRTETVELPGHREGALADKLAAMAARAMGRSAVVIAGIHLDNPSRDEVEAVVVQAQTLMKETLERLIADRTATI